MTDWERFIGVLQEYNNGLLLVDRLLTRFILLWLRVMPILMTLLLSLRS